jgi:hypothetical protein
VSGYAQCHLQSSNFDISFSEDRQRAFVRSNYITHWLYKRDMFDNHFDAGGVYRWTMRREDRGATKSGRPWAISKIDLYCAWTTGDDGTGVTQVCLAVLTSAPAKRREKSEGKWERQTRKRKLG